MNHKITAKFAVHINSGIVVNPHNFTISANKAKVATHYITTTVLTHFYTSKAVEH